jgi:hypothetical protein
MDATLCNDGQELSSPGRRRDDRNMTVRRAMYRNPVRSEVPGASAAACSLFVLALAATPLSAQELDRDHQAELINDLSQGLRHADPGQVRGRRL